MKKKKKVVKQVGRLVKNIGARTRTGDSVKSLDAQRVAKPPGRRVSASGNVYTETRQNRSDKNRKKRL